MKRKNTMRNALVTSVISMLLCVSMLVGTTFAWFTDEVVSGMNTIAAGNLDIELLAGGNKVDNTTKLFDGVEKWEPGVVVYENLEIANVGTLALKYQMTLNFKDNNDLNGHKLSEVVKVALVDKIEASATRAQVLELAKAAVAADKGNGNLANFYTVGELLPGKTTGEKAVVVFWEPTDHDNDYNANNGQKTSDGKPLSIEFGINLQATQLMHEEDSFGPDYDKEAAILPKATVNNQGAQTVKATVNAWGGNAATIDYDLPFVLQFLPNETLEQAQASQYRYWHADYVVTADRDVSGVTLGGYYKAFCGPDDGTGDTWNINDGRWVVIDPGDEVIAAGTEVRLVQMLGDGNITVNYEDICEFGNDGIGFLCGAADASGKNAGTTLTVELRMYEVPGKGECAKGGGCEHDSYDCELGADKYKVVGTYTYTFVNAVSTAAELKAQLAAGNDVTLADDIALDNNDTIAIAAGNDVTIDLNGHKLSATADKSGNQEAFLVKGDLTVKNGSMEMTALNNQGWNAMATIFDVTAGGVLNLEGVTANTSGTDMSFVAHLNNWGEVTLNAKDCILTSNYVAVRVFNSGNDMNNVTIENSTLKGGSVAFWVHNYTEADFGGKLYSGATAAYDAALVAARLNFNLTGNTLVGSPEKAGPVRLGMSNSIYGDVTVLP